MQFSGHHSYLKKDLQLLLAINEVELGSPHHALDQAKKINFPHTKKILTTKTDYIASPHLIVQHKLIQSWKSRCIK